MNKQNENLFREKFRLLNSQEHSEDIKWSSTSSSEPESTILNNNVNEDRRRNRKRKRKKNVLKNISNLDITFIDSCKNEDSCVGTEKSPILKSRRVTSVMSPVLTISSFPPNRDPEAKSPVLSTKRICSKSPVLNLKTTSLNISGRVKKKLCYDKESYHKDDELKKLKLNNEINTKLDSEIKEDQTELKNIKNESESETKSTTTLNDNNSLLKSKLMVKVKNFFDSHFSQEHTSQNISTTDTTPSDGSKNEDIDILSCKTQTVTNLQSVKFESVTNSDTSNFDGNIKKVKYKKGGLGFRLNALVKKQNAHISLWQHERFLASNSNFIIPKEEHKVFHIQTFEFQYGCYLLSVIDMENKKFVILINKKNVNTTIVENSVLKLYEPFKILSMYSDVKIIVNVCKFECVLIKS